MDQINLKLVNYLAENHILVLSHPISGQVKDVYPLFIMCLQHWEETEFDARISFSEFVNDLQTISQVAPGSLSFITGGTLCMDINGEQTIDFIHVDTLKILYNQFYPGHYVFGPTARDVEQPVSLVDRLMAALKDSEGCTPNGKILSKLEKLLETKPASVELARERARNTVSQEIFIDSCTNTHHSSILSTASYISNNKITSLQWDKLNRCEQECPGLVNCVSSKIHFIPNLKPQTDISLGDCSYLDTCHKLNSCRYVHYLQYVPESLVADRGKQLQHHNALVQQNKKIGFYTLGDCCSIAVKPNLPAQWIQCDIRKFDFNILGKFSAVIADPAWNIHMNLPYGTCNDNELLNLPLHLLQDEGIILLWVTGRAIELGKESLKNWGYKVINEISWIKTNQLGRTIVTGRTGHWLNHSKEHLLVGVKGDPHWLNKQVDIDLIVSSTRETSRKPDELYGMVERLVGPNARKLEIFGRDHNTRSGWFTIGNQLNSSRIYELDVKRKYQDFVQNTKQRPERHALESLRSRQKMAPNHGPLPALQQQTQLMQYYHAHPQQYPPFQQHSSNGGIYNPDQTSHYYAYGNRTVTTPASQTFNGTFGLSAM